MVNRESLPLILILLIPIILVGLIVLYFYGYDVTVYLRKVNILYYIILVPIALGFTAGIIKYMKPD